jgi:hypothetical protein
VLAGWDNNLYFLFLGVILLVAAFANEWIRNWATRAGRPGRPPDIAVAHTHAVGNGARGDGDG